MHPNNQEHPAWEQWQLTAFVLGDLDQETAAQIEAAAQEDAQLSAELAAIRQTATQITQVYRMDSASDVTPGEFDAVLRRAGAERASSGSRKLMWGAVLAASLLLVAGLYWNGTQGFQYMAQSTSDRGDTAGANAVRGGTSQQLTEDFLQAPVIVAGSQPADSEEASGSSDEGRSAYPAISERLEQLRQQVSAAQGSGRSPRAENESAELYASPLPALPSIAPAQPSRGQPMSSEAAKPFFAESEQLYGDGLSLPEVQATPSPADVFGGGNAGMGGYGGGYGGEGGYGDGGESDYGAGGYGGGYGGEVGYGVSPAMDGERDLSESLAQTRSYTDNYGRGLGLAEGIVEEGEALRPAAGPEAYYFRRRAGARSDPLGDRFESIVENQFQSVAEQPLSTFSIDVDSASYTKCRQLLLEANRLPPPGAVRIEEFINYFDYEYAGPSGAGEEGEADPFGAALAVASCPWNAEHQLVRIALQATKLDLAERPKANIVFLLDVSGSMDEPNKLPLVKESMRMLTRQLGENDRVAMVVYAGAAGCVLEGTRGDQQAEILDAIKRLNAGGSTNGGQGIQLAYNLARDNFIPGGINRIILCTDGDFNVGVTSTDALIDLVAENAKSNIFLTVLGYGIGNLNDAMMEKISNQGNGVYGFVDSRREAHRQMVQQLAGNLMTVAKDVKIQVEFNPQNVDSYRLIGYENRVMANEDFDNDKKDAGEIGAGHRVTALYEIVPTGASRRQQVPADELRYQPRETVTPEVVPAGDYSEELLVVKLRYKQPESETSKLLSFPLDKESQPFAEADRDFRWAATVAQFGMLLRQSSYRGSSHWSGLLEQADAVAGVSPDASRIECLEMIRRAAHLSRAAR